MGFFSLKNAHMMFVLVGAFIAIPVIINVYYHDYLAYAGYLSVFGIVVLIVGLSLNARIQGPNYPHIEHTVFNSANGIAYAVEHFFIEIEPEPGAAVPEVYSLMEKGPDGKDVPKYWFGRWWYPYLAITHWPIDTIGDFRNSLLHIFVLPHPWKMFLGFGRRKDAAYLTGEVISHSGSTHLDSILAPFKVDYLGVEIPVYLGILSTYTISRITQGWAEGMKELARMLTSMNDLIEAHKDKIFPEKELEEMVEHVFPHVKIPSARNKRKGEISR